MKYRLQRKPPDAVCTMGEWFNNGTHFCWTLERLPSDPVHPCIPAGIYALQKYISPHLGREVLLLLNVPGRSEIEVHNANYVYQLLGCIAVGQSETVDAVWNSVAALNALLATFEPGSMLEVRDPDPMISGSGGQTG